MPSRQGSSVFQELAGRLRSGGDEGICASTSQIAFISEQLDALAI